MGRGKCSIVRPLTSVECASLLHEPREPPFGSRRAIEGFHETIPTLGLEHEEAPIGKGALSLDKRRVEQRMR